MMPISKAGISNKKGFTFIEIAVVLFILSIFAVVALPRLGSFLDSGKMLESSSKLAFYLEHMRDESIYRGKIIVVRSNLDDNSFHALIYGDNSGESRTSSSMRPFSLPQDVRIMDIDIPGSSKISGGEAAISFYPGGSADGALIHLRDMEEKDVTLELSPFSRTVRITEGYVQGS